MHKSGPVIIMQLPERLNHRDVQTFSAEIQPILECDRPRVVLDCSLVQYMDSTGVEMLLRCVQEGMKRDGDLKLAAVSPAAAVILELMRVDRLFETFETTDEAVQSFHAFTMPVIPQNEPVPGVYGAFADMKAAS
ncbi:MAG: STAS domain-containing protein [Terriglobales bacterium]|jgi:anti-anti-sigma factor